MSQKGQALLIVLLIAAAIGGYLVYSGKINLPQKQVVCTQEAKICPDGTKVGRSGPKCEFASCPSVKTDETVTWERINGFPVYPKATFIKKGTQDNPCDQVGDKTIFCTSTTYTWGTEDDFDKVNSWYVSDKSNSGWKCSGGAGSVGGPRDARITTTCTKGDLHYGLNLNADSQKTEIILGILPK